MTLPVSSSSAVNDAILTHSLSITYFEPAVHYSASYCGQKCFEVALKKLICAYKFVKL